MIPIEPGKIPMPFAYEGGRNDILESGGETTGEASYPQGFPPITQAPLSQGGIPPRRKDFNGILYVLSAYAFFAQSGGVFAYDATVDYVRNCIITHDGQLYICLTNNGPGTSAGAVEPGTNDTYWQTLLAFLLGATEDIGSDTRPIYVKDGAFTASSATVGSGTRPVYLNSGTITASSSTVGSGTKPVYLNGGTIAASGSTVGSGTKPVYLSSGTIAASSSTVGDESTPVYLKAGTLTACSGGMGVESYSLGTSGYVKFSMGLIIQWGTLKTTGADTSPYTVTFPVSFSSASSYVIVKNPVATGRQVTYDREVSFYSKTAKTATTYQAYGSNEEWLAIGY